MKSVFFYIMVIAVLVAVAAPWVAADQAEEPDSLLSNIEGAGGSKPFNLQGANSQRRAHGIYFNGR